MLPDTEITSGTLEFGTSPLLEVLKALRTENWLHHYGGKKRTDAEKIQAELLRVFYPGTDDWKILVWKQGKEVVEQALEKVN